MMAWIFAILLGCFAKSYPALPGIILCFIGAALRFWASGYLRKDSRPAVGGPYAFIRNPLYLGTYLMAVGTLWAMEITWLALTTTVIFAAIYHYIILDEEEKLKKIFAEPYLLYLKTVPRFFPRIWPPFARASRIVLKEVNPEVTHSRFSWDLLMRNKGYEAFATFAGLMAYVTLAAYFWQGYFSR